MAAEDQKPAGEVSAGDDDEPLPVGPRSRDKFFKLVEKVMGDQPPRKSPDDTPPQTPQDD